MPTQSAAIKAAIGFMLCLPLAVQTTSHAAAAASKEEQLDELETVVVVGEFPGPGLWKVSKGDHIMWVLASYSPLPKDMVWRSQKIEARIAESQEVLHSGGVNLGSNIGLLRGLTLIPAAMKASKIPDDKTLKDVLAPATYEKWLVLRKKYIGKDDDVERYRPSIALGQLRNAAVRKNDLGGADVADVVNRASKKYKVKKVVVPTVKRTLKVEDPRGMLKSAQKIGLPDIACFTRDLDKVEADIERVKTLANAWSRGDIAKLRSMNRNVKLRDAVREGCGYELLDALNEGPSDDAAHAKKMMDDALWHVEQASLQAQIDWVAAARAALDRNKSTFAVLSMAEVFSPEGHLEKLRELGYKVEAPQ